MNKTVCVDKRNNLFVSYNVEQSPWKDEQAVEADLTFFNDNKGSISMSFYVENEKSQLNAVNTLEALINTIYDIQTKIGFLDFRKNKEEDREPVVKDNKKKKAAKKDV